MVDVGYFIDGKHGVIKNVTPIANTVTDHLTFANVANDEQYALKKENIEYVIPSDMDCVSEKIVFDKDGVIEYGADGSVVVRGSKNLLPPITTNADKFKETFGFEPNRNKIQEVCDMIDCVNVNCEDCPYYNRSDWDDEYVKVEG